MSIGGYGLNRPRVVSFSCSNPYLQASLGFCFKESDAYLPFTRLTAPFTKYVWIMTSVLLILSIIIILLSKNLTQHWRHFIVGGRMNRTPILNMWSSVLGNPISNRRISNGGRSFGTFSRTLFILWIITWFVIRNSYQGSLYTYLQSHRYISPYDTTEKIRASDCKVLATPSALSLIANIIDRQR